MQTHRPNTPGLIRSTQTPAACKGQRGFPLLELLTVLALAAVLLAAGGASLATLVKQYQLSTQSNHFLSSLMLARSEAIKRNGRVVLCKLADGVGCTRMGNWEQGWIMFHDADNDGVRDAAEPLVQRTQALPGSLRLVGNQYVAHYVSFAPIGNAKFAGNNGFQLGTLTLCNRSSTGTKARDIVLSPTGRARTVSTSVNACA